VTGLAYVFPSSPSSLSGSAFAAFDRAARSSRWTGLAFVVAIHVLLIAAIWRYTPARAVIAHAAPVIVQLLAPEPLPPAEAPPPARPVVKLKPPPLTPVEKPVTPVVPIEPDVPPLVTQAPVLTPTPPAPPVDIVAPAPPAPATPPRFDADYLRNPAPSYPPISRRNAEQGRVLLRVLVGPDGDARDVTIQTSSGFERLDRAAQETVRQWRFVPARLGANAVAAWVIVPISFSLAHGARD
jgi:protein TonB